MMGQTTEGQVGTAEGDVTVVGMDPPKEALDVADVDDMPTVGREAIGADRVAP